MKSRLEDALGSIEQIMRDHECAGLITLADQHHSVSTAHLPDWLTIRLAPDWQNEFSLECLPSDPAQAELSLTACVELHASADNIAGLFGDCLEVISERWFGGGDGNEGESGTGSESH